MELGGGFKDEASAAKVTFFGGYVHVDMATRMVLRAPTSDSIRSVAISYGLRTTPTRSYTDKILQTFWAGATYETGAWTFTGAWYRLNQNNYHELPG